MGEKGVSIASNTIATVSTKVQLHLKEVKTTVRNMVKDLDIGGVNIEHLLFAENIETIKANEEKLAFLIKEKEAKKLAAEKKLAKEKELKQKEAEEKKMKLEKMKIQEEKE